MGDYEGIVSGNAGIYYINTLQTMETVGFIPTREKGCDTGCNV